MATSYDNKYHCHLHQLQQQRRSGSLRLLVCVCVCLVVCFRPCSSYRQFHLPTSSVDRWLQSLMEWSTDGSPEIKEQGQEFSLERVPLQQMQTDRCSLAPAKIPHSISDCNVQNEALLMWRHRTNKATLKQVTASKCLLFAGEIVGGAKEVNKERQETIEVSAPNEKRRLFFVFVKFSRNAVGNPQAALSNGRGDSPSDPLSDVKDSFRETRLQKTVLREF